MAADGFFAVSATRLNLREKPGLDATVLSTLAGGTTVERLSGDAADAWWQVRPAGGAIAGYVARRYLRALSRGTPPLLPAVNSTLWSQTAGAITAGVRYLLGAKDITKGAIDCSGWVDHTTWAAFDAVNALAAPGEAFDRGSYDLLRTHSDGIISGVEARTGRAFHGNDVSLQNLHEGMLVGVNFGTYRWEEGPPRRVYGIDHIVQVVRHPDTGILHITQSSHSSNGVNTLPLAEWLQARRDDGLMASGKVHAVDPFLLADPHIELVSTLSASGPAVAGAAQHASLPAAFSGRGVYVATLADVLKRYGSAAAAIAEMKRCRFSHVWVRIHGRNYIGDVPGGQAALKPFIDDLKSSGLAVAGWGWCQGDDISGEIRLATQSLAAFGLDSYVADIEQGVNHSNWLQADITTFLTRVRARVRGLCVTSHGFIDWFEPQLFKAVEDCVDCFNPQAYWYGTSPSQKMLNAIGAAPGTYRLANAAAYAQLCLDRYRRWYGRPVVITGQAYSEGAFSDGQAEAKLTEFFRNFNGWAQPVAINWWHLGAMTQAMRDTLAAGNL